MAAFINAEQAKIMSNQAYLDIEVYKLRLASLIEESAKQGNTAVFTSSAKTFTPRRYSSFFSRTYPTGISSPFGSGRVLLSFKRVLDLKLRFDVLVYIVWIKIKARKRTFIF